MSPIDNSEGPWKECIGTSRIAYVGPRYTVKVPRLDLIGWAVDIADNYNEMTSPHKIDPAQRGSVSYYLRGVRANRREVEFAPQLEGIVAPTAWHCGEWEVAQPTLDPVSLNVRQIGQIIRRHVSSNHIYDFSHTFASPKNYGVTESGQVLLVDFGEENVGEFILKNRWEIERAFAALARLMNEDC